MSRYKIIDKSKNINELREEVYTYILENYSTGNWDSDIDEAIENLDEGLIEDYIREYSQDGKYYPDVEEISEIIYDKEIYNKSDLII